MSTKIYDAWRVPTTSFTELRRQVQLLRESALRLTQQKMKAYVLHQALEAFDTACARGQPDGTNYLAAMMDSVHERVTQLEKTRQRDSAVDFSLSLTFFPRSRDTLVMGFVERPELRALISAQPGWEDFSYWNNTDRPEHLSAAQWTARAKAWEQALGTSSIPAESGFSMTVLAANSWWMDPAWSFHLPETFPPQDVVEVPLDERVRGAAQTFLLEHEAEKAQEEGRALTLSQVARVLRTFQQHENYAQVAEEVRKLLKPVVHAGDLLGATKPESLPPAAA